MLEKGSKKLVLHIGKTDYELSDEKKKMDTAALLKEGTKTVAGFVVPLNTNLTAIEERLRLVLKLIYYEQMLKDRWRI